MAFYYQLFLQKLPCGPMCISANGFKFILAFGLLLNLTHGNSYKHYLLIILVTLFKCSYGYYPDTFTYCSRYWKLW